MKLRLSALLCLASLPACSQTPETTIVNDPSDANTASAASAEPTSEYPARAQLEPGIERDRPRLNNEPAQDRPNATNAPGVLAPASGTVAPATAVQPPSAERADAATPDNTRVNKRDTDGSTLTPTDQQENPRDLKITQQIRQAVMADKSLSFTAKNVKIITINGNVTLRGPVNSTQERSAIEGAARRVAGIISVDNQIEVKQ